MFCSLMPLFLIGLGPQQEYSSPTQLECLLILLPRLDVKLNPILVV